MPDAAVSPHRESRRRNALGVHSLDHFAIAVPDLAVASDFFTAFGLDVREEGTELGLCSFGHPHCWARIVRGERKALKHISFGIFADDLDAFASHLAGLGIAATRSVEEGPPSLWLNDLHGVPIELRVAPKTSPDGKGRIPSQAGALRGAPMRGETRPIRPRRLSHAAFFTPDIDATLDFYTRALGLRLSDRSGPAGFLHGVHGSEHHLVAFVQSSRPGFHHSAWDVPSLDAVGLGAEQMAEAGHRAGWGLGRHVLGSNYFHYVRDPWGSYAEYSFDIDYVPADLEWPSAEVPPDNSLYLWGPPPPSDFGDNFEGSGH